MQQSGNAERQKEMKKIEKTFAGRPLSIETGRMARQAAGSCVVQYGDTVLLCAVTVQSNPTHLPFFPLTVEYKERTYAAGKFPGGFIKREGRPSDSEILAARLTDRPLRPLFPEGFMHETQVVAYVVSSDKENDADTLALLGASVALNLSEVPFKEPVASVRVGRIEGNWILNPTFKQLEYSDVDMVVAGTARSIMMVEGGAVEVPESDLVEGLQVAHEGIRELIDIQNELIKAVGGKPKMDWQPILPGEDLRTRVEELASTRMAEAFTIGDKVERNTAMKSIRDEVLAALAEEFPEQEKPIGAVFGDIEYTTMRRQILEKGVRSDGRGLEDVRPITCEVGLLPRTHGSALFTRGQTQSLAVATLGTTGDEQRVDSIYQDSETSKSFMLHYNFPPFSTGEAKPMRGTSRRDIGHGSLAERAIQPLLPPYDEFPYTIRVVSDILESNGSSSMASVCGASLALMDAGVPLSGSCAGVAMGLIKEGDKVAILTDILGVEDALGDMDFKVAGTRNGVTSIQMDIKLEEGMTIDIMKEALTRANRGRMHILDVMEQTLTEHRSELSQYAPRIITMQINPEKIGEVIGPKGKTIRAIQEETGATINIDDTGMVSIASVSAEGGQRARDRISAITQDPEIGRIYEGIVKSTTAFGAFVEIVPGVEGLVHISELQDGRTEKTEDVVKKGDIARVKLLSIDEKGRLRLSRKAAMAEDAAPAAPQETAATDEPS